MKYCILVLYFFLVSQAHAQPVQPQVTTVEFIDLKKYLGTWFEIAAIPQSFQKQCVGNTTAVYGLTEAADLITVVNSCDTKSGERSIANGRAKVIDEKSSSKLKVTFVNFLGWKFIFGGDYWILSIGENYEYAVVVSPSRDYAWILSRDPQMLERHLREAMNALSRQGFDTCQLITTPQKGGLQAKKPLCELEIGE